MLEKFKKINEEIEIEKQEYEHYSKLDLIYNEAWHDYTVSEDHPAILDLIAEYNLIVINKRIFPEGYDENSDYEDYKDKLESFSLRCHELSEEMSEMCRDCNQIIKSLQSDIVDLIDAGLVLPGSDFKLNHFYDEFDITIPEGVTAIDEVDAEKFCRLRTINLCSTIKEIHPSFFNLKCNEINVDSNNPHFESLDGVLYSKGLKKILRVPTNTANRNFTIPQSVEVICSRAFYDTFLSGNVIIHSNVKEIQPYAFYRCHGYITLSEGLEVISDSAFEDLYKFNFDSLPKSIKVIGRRSFNSCGSIIKLRLHEGLESIGAQAFADQFELKNIELPKSLTSIGERAFDTKSVNIYTKHNSKPDGWNEKFCDESSVISYGSDFFDPADFFELTDVVLPDGLVTIGEKAFQNSLLKSITIPNSVKYIQPYAFSDCTELETIVFSDNIIEIGRGAFKNCVKLKELNFPDTLTKIDHHAFNGCKGLNSLKMSKNLSVLGVCAFLYCEKLIKVELFDGLKTLDNFAFSDCTQLSEVILPNDLETIALSAFSDCISLKEITLPKTVIELGKKCFSATSLENIVLPDSLKVMGPGVFQNCLNITEITIPDNINTIEESTFSGCSNITTIHLPKNLKVLGSEVFKGCEKIKEINLPEGLLELSSKSLGYTNIEEVLIPSTVEVIEADFTFECKMLKSINVDSNNPNFESIYGLLFNKELTYLLAYPKANTASEFEIPKAVTSVGDALFMSCSNLKKVTLNKKVKVLSVSMFENCTNLEEVVFPGIVKIFSENAFRNCISLKEINIPQTLTTIEHNAFYNCTNLTSLSFPKTLSTLNGSAFTRCYSLATISVEEGCKKYIFEDNIVYSKDGKTAIASAPARDAEVLLLPSTVETIESYAFTSSLNLKTIAITKNIIILKGFAFNDLINLQNFTVEEANYKFTEIDGNLYSKAKTMFYYYAAGKKEEVFTLPERLLDILTNAFSSATNLKEIIINEGVTNINRFAFKDCTNLLKVVLPSTIFSLGDSVFLNNHKDLCIHFKNYARCASMKNFNPDSRKVII